MNSRGPGLNPDLCVHLYAWKFFGYDAELFAPISKLMSRPCAAIREVSSLLLVTAFVAARPTEEESLSASRHILLAALLDLHDCVHRFLCWFCVLNFRFQASIKYATQIKLLKQCRE